VSHEIIMVRDGGCLRPHGNADSPNWATFDLLRTTKPVVVTIKQARHPEHHNKIWAIAAKVADHDDDFIDAEDAMDWVKIHIPNMRKIVVMRDGRTVVSTKSISFANMDQIRFNRFYDRAMCLWTDKIGCDPEGLLEAAEAA
jgi:hypothetical protein